MKMPKNEEGWKRKLTREQYRVLREKATEMPFTGKLLLEKRKGKFTCAACGNVLFDSDVKFDSGTGWPSFYDVRKGAVKFVKDKSMFMNRT
ncbi:MAG: peptide-methionine (R)-S-oxide reductase, partial [Nanoarchaeota archaeon]